jgi:hypothetical protein
MVRIVGTWGLIGGEKTGLIVSAFLPRNLDFLKGYAESAEQKQIALQKQQTREYQGKRIEALARGQEGVNSRGWIFQTVLSQPEPYLLRKTNGTRLGRISCSGSSH